MDSDADLLRRYVVEGSNPAFRELVERHIDSVYHAALRQLNGNRPLAEDVTQAVFTHFALKASRLSPEVVLAGWLYTTTHYTVANARRSEARRHRRDQEVFAMQPAFNEPAPEPRWETVRPLLDELLWQLKQADRDAVLLRFFQGRTYRQIAAALSLTENGARMRIERAMERLRQLLAKRGIQSSAAALGTLLAEHPSCAAPPAFTLRVAQQAFRAATGKASAATGILQFMATSKTVLVAAGVAAMVAVGSASYRWADAKAAGFELSTAESDYRASLQTVRSAAAQARAAEASAANAQRSGDALAMATPTQDSDPAPARRSGATRNPPNPRDEGRAFLQRHPDVATALTDHADATTHQQYLALYRQLSMNADQVKQFEIVMRARTGRFGRQLAFGTIDLELAEAPSKETFNSALMAVLGDDGFRELQRYSQTIPARNLSAELASLAVETSTPISPSQGQQLADVFASAWNRQRGTFDWDAAVANASAVLSPAQLELLNTLRTRSEAWQQVVASTR